MTENITAIIQRHPVWTASAAIALVAAIPAYQDYRSFMSLGAGGPPHNALGWYWSRFAVSPWGREMISTQMYEEDIDKGGSKSCLGFKDGRLPRRKGGRPTVGSHAVPNRQTSQIPEEEMQKNVVAAFNALAAKNTHIVKLATSRMERHGDAMWLRDDVPHSPEAVKTKGEISHIHGTGDHSLHVVLSPADAKEVIDAGWGQRHPFSGMSPLGGRIVNLPSTYIHVYAPRNQEELDVVMEIVRAGMRHVSMGAEVVP